MLVGHFIIHSLHGAVTAEQHEATRILLESHATADVWSITGDTPLLLAVKTGHQGIVRLLLEHGANPENCNNDGQFPLSIAVHCGNLSSIDFLVQVCVINCDFMNIFTVERVGWFMKESGFFVSIYIFCDLSQHW